MNPVSPLGNIRVVLSHTTHPGNIGAAARAMRTMDITALYLVNPRRFPDADASAMAAGADEILANAIVCADLDEALVETTLVVGLTARRRDLSHDMLTIREAAPRIVQEAAAAPVALLFGTEISGLSNAELDKCQLLATIPTDPVHSSLNLAASVQVSTYEVRQAAFKSITPEEQGLPAATFQDVEGFYAHLEQTLYDTGFLDPDEPKRLMQGFIDRKR